jgi:hypothetical protein
MRVRQPYPGFMVIMAVGFALILVSGIFQPAQAGSEDVAMFYDELSQHGQWVDYEKYGPVWTPSQVGENWRPYTDGRWVPSREGYVFETREPWGWATYHYGNWMPTDHYGWVWVPGRTWYPSTVTWRTSPEGAATEAAYVGWAPIPPPNYVPTSAYAPSGYYPGMPAVDLITAPFYVFSSAARFLLGLGMPFGPTYSYVGCGCLAPPVYVPTFFPQTVMIQNYVVPGYYPQAFFGAGAPPLMAYNWGPPIPYIARVTRINQMVINQTMVNNSVNLARIHNVVPPAAVMQRHAYLSQIMPPALAQGRPLPSPQLARDVGLAQANLGKPGLISAPRQVPQIPLASIPKAPLMPAQAPGRGMVGAGLPAQAVQPLTPKMQQQVQALPPNQQIVPAGPMKPPAAAAAPFAAPGEKPRTTGVKPAVPGAKATVTPGVKPGAPGAPTVGAKPAAPTGAKPTTPPAGYKPPTAGTGYKPPTAGPGYKPPTAGPGYKPPTAGTGYKPPTAGPGYKPPTTAGPGYKPPATGPGYKPPTGGPGSKPPVAQPSKPASAPPRPAAPASKKPESKPGEKKSPPPQ